MTQPSESDLLNQRLDAIRAEKAPLLKRLNELEAQEERINYALEIMRDVLAEVCGPSKQVELPIGGVGAVAAVAHAGPRQTLEQLIIDVFIDKTGMTSGEVADMVDMFSPVTVKRESILSTLSRMASKEKGLVRREGKLYFMVKKGESPEVVATTGPSVATESVAGQHTSGALIGEEGEEL
jgi:hypothetical protein